MGLPVGVIDFDDENETLDDALSDRLEDLEMDGDASLLTEVDEDTDRDEVGDVDGTCEPEGVTEAGDE